ncbi:LLM class flavin-dependent oxidoreductase [Isoptericola sp. b441]|uniref:LLM class flavin-dependent oxidoreductase n=1 Tax=Actinotalea lenta TaxID=3064654 RepID=A0ABT9D6B1_9CELL|nr:LLM class flavin-dependent oxidoreductase [Isoptericola sp. b441]MDO8106367.1 LLM class flavin-dependent oxidoreductase [Isoptericola sp. b441]
MRYGIEVVPFGEYTDPRRVVELAHAAEDAGWDAISVWDHAHFWGGVGDPWVTLAAVAVRTARLRLLTGVTPVPRYRPHLLARTLHALDALSEGRVTLGAGLGVDEDLDPVGDGAAARVRASMTDEALPLITRWLAGETVTHAGAHYRAEAVQVCPGPVQDHVPVWVGGSSGAALRRAARWDGWFAGCIDEARRVLVGPERIAERVDELRGYGASPVDVAVNGTTEPGDRLPAQYEEAGATWWFESLFGLRGSPTELLERVSAGPPT